jgi:peptidoglycan/LPS O-acetylase OafA/YrhL
MKDEPRLVAKREHYPNFDILRLALALEVVFDHARYMVNPSSVWNAPIMAVPAFLAVSGFLVLKSYQDSGSWLIFLEKRALRILPALVFSMLLCFILFNWFAVYNSFLNWITGGLYTLNGVANGPLWSLAWEELAYLLLAILWTCGAYRRTWCIWIIFGTSLYIVHRGHHLDPHTQILLFLGPAFFVGNLMYLYRKVLLRVHPSIPWLFLLAVIFNYHIPLFSRLVSLSPVTLQSFSIVWVGIAGRQLVPFKFPDISYGVYIYHMLIIIFLIQHGFATSLKSMLTLLPITLLLVSVGSWYLVEKPALSLKSKLRSYSRRPPDFE